MTTVSAKEFLGGGIAKLVQPINSASAFSIPSPEERKGRYMNGPSLVERTSDILTSNPRIAQDFSKRGENISNAIAGEGQYQGQSPLRRGVEATAETFNAIPTTAFNAIPSDTIRGGLSKVGEGIGKGFKEVTDTIAEIPQIQEFAQSDMGNIASEVAGIGSGTGQIAGDILFAQQGANALQRGVDVTKNVINKISPLEHGKELYNSVKEHLSRQNVNPQVETSAKELINRTKEPISAEPETSITDKYNKYFEQAKGAKTNIKADPPVSSVGEDIGDQFNKVVKMRRDVGQTINNELEKIGDHPTDLTKAMTNLEDNLFHKEGLRFNGNGLTSDSQSAMSASDSSLLNSYIRGMNKLEVNPTVKDLDSFMRRITSEMDLYNAKNNIIGTTNGERIIQGSLADLREQFNPEITGNPALADYYSARQLYSNLSDFVTEGKKYLGDVTQAGDFAKDASLAKSAVQSILNNGKKDWLVKLEGLTGYPALDNSVMALQAMKDAGDFRGLSLLQTLADDIPHTQSGLTERIAEWLIGKTKGQLLGSPDEQTRTFLKSLQDEKLYQNTTNTQMIPNSMASPGATAQSMKNSNNGTIDSSIPQSENNAIPNQEGGFVKNPLYAPESKNMTDLMKSFEPGGNTANGIKMLDNMSKDMPVYQDAVNKVYTPDRANWLIGDTVNNFKLRGFEDLGQQLKNALIPMENSLTPDKLVQTAKSIIQNASTQGDMGSVIKSTAPVLPTGVSPHIDAVNNTLNSIHGIIDTIKQQGARQDFKGIPKIDSKQQLAAAGGTGVTTPPVGLGYLVPILGSRPEAIAGDIKLKEFVDEEPTPQLKAALDAYIRAILSKNQELSHQAQMNYLKLKMASNPLIPIPYASTLLASMEKDYREFQIASKAADSGAFAKTSNTVARKTYLDHLMDQIGKDLANQVDNPNGNIGGTQQLPSSQRQNVIDIKTFEILKQNYVKERQIALASGKSSNVDEVDRKWLDKILLLQGAVQQKKSENDTVTEAIKAYNLDTATTIENSPYKDTSSGELERIVRDKINQMPSTDQKTLLLQELDNTRIFFSEGAKQVLKTGGNPFKTDYMWKAELLRMIERVGRNDTNSPPPSTTPKVQITQNPDNSWSIIRNGVKESKSYPTFGEANSASTRSIIQSNAMTNKNQMATAFLK